MPTLRALWILLFSCEVIFGVSASTHWIVTENGKIQPRMKTVFDMQRPYDLITFLEQEKNIEAMISVYKRIVAWKSVIDRRWMTFDSTNDVNYIEKMLYSKDSDCLLAGKPLGDIDLYTGIVTNGSSRNGITWEDFVLEDIPADTKKKVPNCKTTFPLNFSMYTFEHLSAMQSRRNLTQPKEKSLTKYFPAGYDLKKFGHQIANGLLRNKTSWLHLNLAAIYWRIRGSSYDALECSRRAIISAPRQYRDIPLLTTAGILHAAGHTGDAAIVLHMAIDHNPTESLHHLALGNVYAVLGDYNRSIACYDNCLRLVPGMDEAKQVKHALLCGQKLKKTLSSLHQQMQEILSELRAYQTEQEEWMRLHERILLEQASQSAFAELENLVMKDQLLATFLPAFGKVYYKVAKDDFTVSPSFMELTKMFVDNTWIDIDARVRLLNNIERQAKEILDWMNQNMGGIRPFVLDEAASNDDRGTKSKVLERRSFARFDLTETTRNPIKISLENAVKADNGFLFPIVLSEELKYTEAYRVLNDFYTSITDDDIDLRNMHIPGKYGNYLLNLEDCQNTEQESWNAFDFVSHQLQLRNIHIDDEIKTVNRENSIQQPHCRNYGADEIDDLSELTPEVRRRTKFYTRKWLTMITGDRQSTVQQLGTKIAIALQKNSTSWTLAFAAALYWRIEDDSRSALNCLWQALEKAPKDMQAVPVMSIASLMSTHEYHDYALSMAQSTIIIAPKSVISYYTVANFHAALGDVEHAIYFYRISLTLDPNFEPAASRLRVMLCSLAKRT